MHDRTDHVGEDGVLLKQGVTASVPRRSEFWSLDQGLVPRHPTAIEELLQQHQIYHHTYGQITYLNLIRMALSLWLVMDKSSKTPGIITIF